MQFFSLQYTHTHVYINIYTIFSFVRQINALQYSQSDQLLPPPQALCLCVLLVLLCCQNWRLVIQSGWRGVFLQIRPMLKELLLHTAPYVAWDCLPAYRRRTFASFPLFLSLSLRLFALLNLPYLVVPPWTIWITLLVSSPLRLLLILLPSSYFQQMPRQILLLSSIRGLEIWLNILFVYSRYSQFYLISIQTLKRQEWELLSLQPCWQWLLSMPELCLRNRMTDLSDGK